jgi:uncharacterized DUF497 family protein
MYKFSYSVEKNKKLLEDRGITFDEIISLIESGKVLDVLEHHNQSKYSRQYIYVIDIDGYIWLVPFVYNDDEIFLKTAFPSRKHTKQYLEEIDG